MYSCFFLELRMCTDLTQFMNVVRLVGRQQRSEVGFSRYLTLNWVSVNKLRLWLT